MPRGSPHSDEVRAAVMAALLAGQGVNDVAAEYSLPTSTVTNWNKAADKVRAKLGLKKEVDEIGPLISQYVKTLLGTLAIQAEFCRDSQWLKEQSAAELGTLHGIMCDKGLRILAAAERAESDDAIG